MMVAIDQYDIREYIPGIHPRKELLEIMGRKKANKMYVDTKDGKCLHIGYVVGRRWFTLYRRFEQTA